MKCNKIHIELLGVLLPDPEPSDDEYQKEVAGSENMKDSDSSFKGFTAIVNSLTDISTEIQEVMMLPHVINTSRHTYAYRV